MKRKLISVVIAQLFVAAPFAIAADGDMKWEGSASLGLRSVTGAWQDPSKMKEYRDMSGIGLTIFEARGQGDKVWADVYGESFGTDDWWGRARGGMYNNYKYELYGNSFRHNFGSGVGALTPYAGAGGSTLTASLGTFASLNQSAWNAFDNSYRRTDYGGAFEWSRGTPWYFRADANQVQRQGTKVTGSSNTTSPGGGFLELPTPIDYKTNNFALEGGYQARDKHFAINWLNSSFTSGTDILRFSNGGFAAGIPGSYDQTLLPPDNQFTKLGMNGMLKNLPMQSSLAARFSYSKTTSMAPVLGTMLTTGNAQGDAGANSSGFIGDVSQKTASVSLASAPAKNVDTKVYYNFNQRQNDSSQIRFASASATNLGGTTAAPMINDLFHYTKDNTGIDAGWKFAQGQKVNVGYDWLKTDRERLDFPKTIDNRYYAEYKNSNFDMATGRLKYQYLSRRSHWADWDRAVPIDQFVRRFDYANVDQNLVKFVLDVAPPIPMLDLGFEAIYKNNDYKDTQIGRTQDQRQEYYVSASYGDMNAWRVTVFYDWEQMVYDSYHRVGNPEGNPATAPTATNYNWSSRNKDRSWQMGVAGDWKPLEKLTLKASAIQAETNGSTDFTSQVVPTGGMLPIPNVDGTRRTSLNFRGVYAYDKKWEFTGGYAFEKYRFSDIGYDAYRYTILNTYTAAPTYASTSYLTGQYAFQNYTSNILYAYAKYKF